MLKMAYTYLFKNLAMLGCFDPYCLFVKKSGNVDRHFPCGPAVKNYLQKYLAMLAAKTFFTFSQKRSCN